MVWEPWEAYKGFTQKSWHVTASWLVTNSAALSQDNTKEDFGGLDGEPLAKEPFCNELFNLQGNPQRNTLTTFPFPGDISIMLGRWDSLLGFSTPGGRRTELLGITSSVNFPPLDILPMWHQNASIKDSFIIFLQAGRRIQGLSRQSISKVATSKTTGASE